MASVPFTLRVQALRVLEESDESSAADEPYVVVYVVDLASRIGTFVIPSAKTTKTGPWPDADEGERKEAIPSDNPIVVANPLIRNVLVVGDACWGMNGKAASVEHADDLGVLVAACENDERSTNQMRTMVNGLMLGSLGSMAGSELTRGEIMKRLLDDFRNAVDQALISEPNLNNDERVGRVQELRLTEADLERVRKDGTTSRVLEFHGGDEGSYRVQFELRRG